MSKALLSVVMQSSSFSLHTDKQRLRLLLMPHVEKQAHVCKLRRNAMVAGFMVAGCELV